MNASRKPKLDLSVACRDRLRREVAVWLAEAHAVIDQLFDKATDMRNEIEAGNSPLGEFLTLDEVARIEVAMEEAKSAVSTVVVPLDGPPQADPMSRVAAVRAAEAVTR